MTPRLRRIAISRFQPVERAQRRDDQRQHEQHEPDQAGRADREVDVVDAELMP